MGPLDVRRKNNLSLNVVFRCARGLPAGVLEGLIRSTFMCNVAADYVAEHFDEKEAERLMLLKRG